MLIIEGRVWMSQVVPVCLLLQEAHYDGVGSHPADSRESAESCVVSSPTTGESEVSPDDVLRPRPHRAGHRQVHERLHIEMADQIHPGKVLVHRGVLHLGVKVPHSDMTDDVEA